MVRKGSPVRVRQRALREVPAIAGASCVKASFRGIPAGSVLGPESGPSGSFWVPSRQEFTDCGRLGRLGDMTTQLELPLAGAGASPASGLEYLTIAEAARRVRCCERTIRRAIDSGALRAGRIRGER